MIRSILYYFRIWLRLTLSSFQTAFVSRMGAFLFTFSKLLRFTFSLLIVVLVVSKTKTLAGYTLDQAIIFFLTYNVIDNLTQLFFRDVYRFRQKVVSGDFDLILIKPTSPLFRVLLGGADPLDLLVTIPYIGLLVIFLLKIPLYLSGLFGFAILVVNSFLIAAAFHIAVLALGILTTEIDHAIMIYRDITSMARFPVDIYQEPLRALITFVIPIGIMMTFPPKALFGLLSFPLLIVATIIGIGVFFLSLKLWNSALRQYTSASS